MLLLFVRAPHHAISLVRSSLTFTFAARSRSSAFLNRSRFSASLHSRSCASRSYSERERASASSIRFHLQVHCMCFRSGVLDAVVALVHPALGPPYTAVVIAALDVCVVVAGVGFVFAGFGSATILIPLAHEADIAEVLSLCEDGAHGSFGVKDHRGDGGVAVPPLEVVAILLQLLVYVG
jgi:hypothetical protein